jgi:hypothetical protein
MIPLPGGTTYHIVRLELITQLKAMGQRDNVIRGTSNWHL